jgi:hypothetical protein
MLWLDPWLSIPTWEFDLADATPVIRVYWADLVRDVGMTELAAFLTSPTLDRALAALERLPEVERELEDHLRRCHVSEHKP